MTPLKRKQLKWTRDELILALDLYFRLGGLPSSKVHPEVVRLSEFLRSLPIYPYSWRTATFRNPAGVYSKLGNFLPFDESYGGVGRPHGNRLDRVIWAEFANNRERLALEARAIWENAGSLDAEHSLDFSFEAAEGRILTRIHRVRERSPELIRKKKAVVLRKTGRLACECCGFDFFSFYGQLGDGFAECHHRKPVAELYHAEKVRVDDLAVVCANCHRMLHRTIPMVTTEELRNLILAEKHRLRAS